MAHVGEEFALGPVSRLCRLLGLQRLRAQRVDNVGAVDRPHGSCQHEHGQHGQQVREHRLGDNRAPPRHHQRKPEREGRHRHDDKGSPSPGVGDEHAIARSDGVPYQGTETKFRGHLVGRRDRLEGEITANDMEAAGHADKRQLDGAQLPPCEMRIPP